MLHHIYQMNSFGDTDSWQHWVIIYFLFKSLWLVALCAQLAVMYCCTDCCVCLRTAEEEMLNQDTILIMVGVGMGVVLFLVMLYCLQQRRSANTNQQGQCVHELKGDPSRVGMCMSLKGTQVGSVCA